MTKSSHSSTRVLAAALRRQAARTGAATPAVRGSDWHRAVVATVGTDGTITTVDGITALRDERYQAPAPGDVIRISIASNGSAVAEGRLADAAAPAGTWVSPALAAGYTNGASSTPVLGNVQYRKVSIGGVVFVQWRGGCSWTTSGTPPLTGLILSVVLAATYRPATQRTQAIGCGGAVVKFDAQPSGAMQIVVPGAITITTWASFHGVSYTLD